MTLPASGALSMSAVNTEIKNAATATISLNDAAVRKMAGKTSGAISFSDLHGKSWWFVDVQQYSQVVNVDGYVYTSYVVDFDHGWPDVYATSITVTDFTTHNLSTGAVTAGPYNWDSNWALTWDGGGVRSYVHKIVAIYLANNGLSLESTGTGKSSATFSIYTVTTKSFSCKINVTFSNGKTATATVTKGIVDCYK